MMARQYLQFEGQFCFRYVSWNRVQVPKRSSSRTIQAKGIYPGAKVTRGPDWGAKYKDQDGKMTTFYDLTMY